MHLFIAALIGALVQAAGTLVGRILLSLGIGFVSYSGIDASIGWAKSQAVASFQGLPAEAIGIIGVLQVGRCISILASALIVRMTLNGLTGGTLKKMVTR